MVYPGPSKQPFQPTAAVSSLHPPIRGRHRQLDDHHSNPNIIDRDTPAVQLTKSPGPQDREQEAGVANLSLLYSPAAKNTIIQQLPPPHVPQFGQFESRPKMFPPYKVSTHQPLSLSEQSVNN